MTDNTPPLDLDAARDYAYDYFIAQGMGLRDATHAAAESIKALDGWLRTPTVPLNLMDRDEALWEAIIAASPEVIDSTRDAVYDAVRPFVRAVGGATEPATARGTQERVWSWMKVNEDTLSQAQWDSLAAIIDPRVLAAPASSSTADPEATCRTCGGPTHAVEISPGVFANGGCSACAFKVAQDSAELGRLMEAIAPADPTDGDADPKPGRCATCGAPSTSWVTACSNCSPAAAVDRDADPHVFGSLGDDHLTCTECGERPHSDRHDMEADCQACGVRFGDHSSIGCPFIPPAAAVDGKS